MKAKKIVLRIIATSQDQTDADVQKIQAAADALFEAAKAGESEAAQTFRDLTEKIVKLAAATEADAQRKRSRTRAPRPKPAPRQTDSETLRSDGQPEKFTEEDAAALECRYYNLAMESIRVLFSQSTAGNHVALVRLRRATTLLMDMAIQPEHEGETEEFQNIPAAAFSQEIPF